MNLKEKLYSIMSSNSALTDIVGDKIYTKNAEISGQIPLVIFNKIDEKLNPVGFNISHFEIITYSKTEAENFTLTSILKDIFDETKTPNIVFSQIKEIKEEIETIEKGIPLYKTTMIIKIKVRK